MSHFRIALLAFAFIGNVSAAHDYTFKEIVIGHPYARATPPGAMSGGAFLTVENRGGTADRMLRVTSPVAGIAELHEMAMENGVMRMRALNGIDVMPGRKVELKPGGYHVMLMDLKVPLKAGETVPLTLTFEKAGNVEVAVEIVPMGAPAAMH